MTHTRNGGERSHYPFANLPVHAMVTVQALCQMFDCTEECVGDMIKDERLPMPITINRSYYWPVSILIEHFTTQCRRSEKARQETNRKVRTLGV